MFQITIEICHCSDRLSAFCHVAVAVAVAVAVVAVAGAGVLESFTDEFPCSLAKDCLS